jgi:arylsulfatase
VASVRVDYTHDLFAEEALRFIRDHRDRTFFLYLALTAPHANNEAGKRGMEVPDLGEYAGLDWPEPQKGHAAMITRMDGDVGRVLDLVKDLGLDEKTLVIFISDNGPFLSYGEHAGSALPLREGKLTVFEGGVRVPCLARWPGRVPAGRVSATPFMALDWLPTFTELVGGKAPTLKTDGRSAKALLLGEPGARAPHDALFFYSGTALQAVRSGPWKLHFAHPYITVAAEPGRAGKPSNFGKLAPTSITQSGVEGIATRHGYRVEQLPLSLYNLNDDPSESKNLAAAHPEIVARLSTSAATIRVELGDSLQKVTGTALRAPGLDDTAGP